MVHEPTAHITVRLCHAITAIRFGYYGNSVTVGFAAFRQSHVPLRRNVLARRRCPTHDLQCPHWASPITQGVPRAKVEPVARDGVGVQTCYRRVCRYTAGHWGLDNAALTISCRRCRAVPYTSSDTPRFPTMLLSPRPFGSRLGGRLRVICLELWPPPGAIYSVRYMAHTFMAHGSTPVVLSFRCRSLTFMRLHPC